MQSMTTSDNVHPAPARNAQAVKEKTFQQLFSKASGPCCVMPAAPPSRASKLGPQRAVHLVSLLSWRAAQQEQMERMLSSNQDHLNVCSLKRTLLPSARSRTTRHLQAQSKRAISLRATARGQRQHAKRAPKTARIPYLRMRCPLQQERCPQTTSVTSRRFSRDNHLWKAEGT